MNCCYHTSNDVIIYFTDGIQEKLKSANIFTVAKRNIDGHDILYQSIKLTNGIWCLIEITPKPALSSVQVNHLIYLYLVLKHKYCDTI